MRDGRLLGLRSVGHMPAGQNPALSDRLVKCGSELKSLRPVAQVACTDPRSWRLHFPWKSRDGHGLSGVSGLGEWRPSLRGDMLGPPGFREAEYPSWPPRCPATGAACLWLGPLCWACPAVAWCSGKGALALALAPHPLPPCRVSVPPACQPHHLLRGGLGWGRRDIFCMAACNRA